MKGLGPAFTAEMKKNYTILIPDMTTIHFKFLAKIFISYGYNVEVLYNRGSSVVDEGLKYVHNDTCYPALLCIGQMIDALHSGKYDIHKTALLLTETGGGCRASNYVRLLRKALDKAGYDFVPVLSLSLKLSGMKSGDNALNFTMAMLTKCMMAIAYGDLIMLLRNQVMPYEKNSGDCDRLTDQWIERLLATMSAVQLISRHKLKKNLNAIAESFSKIEKVPALKPKVGIVGEIYVKYAALGNNDLEKFLFDQGCEVMVPGLYDFLMYSMNDAIEDRRIYGGKPFKFLSYKLVVSFLDSIRNIMRSAASSHGFCAPSSFDHLKHLTDGVIDRGCKMGEGWLLPAEMMELSELGYSNIITVQPFGCLPNHIVAKGMSRTIKEKYPQANIVAVDYDPGATRVNQENRIKLMLSIARDNMKKTPAENGATADTTKIQTFASV